MMEQVLVRLVAEKQEICRRQTNGCELDVPDTGIRLRKSVDREANDEPKLCEHPEDETLYRGEKRHCTTGEEESNVHAMTD